MFEKLLVTKHYKQLISTYTTDNKTVIDNIYSCFEKGCLTKQYATKPKGIMGNGGLWYLIEALGVSAT